MTLEQEAEQLILNKVKSSIVRGIENAQTPRYLEALRKSIRVQQYHGLDERIFYNSLIDDRLNKMGEQDYAN